MEIVKGRFLEGEKVTVKIDGIEVTRKVKYNRADGLYIIYKNRKYFEYELQNVYFIGGKKMEINLSVEMIEKITFVSAGRISDLKAKEDAVKNSMAVGETQIRRKHMQLKDIEKAKADAEEVHALFLEMLEEVESK